MWIKKLALTNFQKHADLQIDFVNGVNVMYGASDAGKSCIRRALEWITQNESIDGIRKSGTKKTSVIITLDNNIEIERMRSQSINRYIIRDGKKEEEFNSIGKSIPDKVKELLTIYPIEVDGEEIYLNSQPQIALPFLFDKSPAFRMKLFNKLTGNDVLDKLFAEFNKDILRIKRNIREESERFENRADELKKKKIQKEKAEAIHSRLGKRIKNLKNIYENYAKLVELKELRLVNNEHIKETEIKLNNLKFPETVGIRQLKENIDRFEQLKTLKNASEKAQISLEKVNGLLSGLKPLSIDLASLGGKIERVDTLKSVYEKFSQNQAQFEKIGRDQKILDKEYSISVNSYKRLLNEMKICPICKNEITEACLKGIKL